ncbi:hypothetical protein CLOM_g11957, partial [Closterium sp. NIES-68]
LPSHLRRPCRRCHSPRLMDRFLNQEIHTLVRTIIKVLMSWVVLWHWQQQPLLRLHHSREGEDRQSEIGRERY